MGGSKFRLFKKLFHYFQMRQDEFYEHYHKRSNVESKFAAVKKKFGHPEIKESDGADERAIVQADCLQPNRSNSRNV